jgi:cilia- and flagella-associated protein 300
MFSKTGEWQPLNQTIHDVRFEQLKTTVLSLEFFDRLYDNKIVRENGGHIRKCIEEYKDEFIVSDELRKVSRHQLRFDFVSTDSYRF